MRTLGILLTSALCFASTASIAQSVILHGFVNRSPVNPVTLSLDIHRNDSIYVYITDSKNEGKYSIDGYTARYFVYSIGSSKQQRQEMQFEKVFKNIAVKRPVSQVAISVNDLLALHSFDKVEIELGAIHYSSGKEVPMHSSKRTFEFLLFK